MGFAGALSFVFYGIYVMGVVVVLLLFWFLLDVSWIYMVFCNFKHLLAFFGSICLPKINFDSLRTAIDSVWNVQQYLTRTIWLWCWKIQSKLDIRFAGSIFLVCIKFIFPIQIDSFGGNPLKQRDNWHSFEFQDSFEISVFALKWNCAELNWIELKCNATTSNLLRMIYFFCHSVFFVTCILHVVMM